MDRATGVAAFDFELNTICGNNKTFFKTARGERQFEELLFPEYSSKAEAVALAANLEFLPGN